MFLIKNNDRFGVFTQEKDKKNCYLMWISSDRKSNKIVSFDIPKNFQLAAAVAGNDDKVIYLIIDGSSVPENDKSSLKKAFFIKADSQTGKEILRQTINTPKAGNEIALHISRTMTVGGDGLNHQGAICVLFDANTLNILNNHGQTSGHSWGDSVQVLENNEFLGVDLGDNYPRGINLWKFNSQHIETKLVYAFKTCHGNKASSPAGKSYPEYTKISTGKNKFYKWSNDNRTYTELAAPGIHEFSDSFAVYFVGECPALDNSNTKGYLNASRNIGFLKINKNLEKMVSFGPKEQGGFFDFGGGWNEQKNEGIQWITTQTNKNVNVSRLKSARVAKNKNVLLFEIWTASSFCYSAFIICDDDGNLTVPLTRLEYPFRLHKSDDIFVVNGKVVFFTGLPEKKIAMFTMEI